MALALVSAVRLFAGMVVYALPVYFITGLRRSLWHFAAYVAAGWVAALFADSILLCVFERMSVRGRPSIENCQAFVSPLLTFFVVISGFYVKTTHLNPVL